MWAMGNGSSKEYSPYYNHVRPQQGLRQRIPQVSKTNQDKGQCSDKIFWEAFSTTTIVKQGKCAERTQEGDFAHYAPQGRPLLIWFSKEPT